MSDQSIWDSGAGISINKTISVLSLETGKGILRSFQHDEFEYM